MHDFDNRRRWSRGHIAAVLRLARAPLTALALGAFVLAAPAAPPEVVVTRAWARPTMPGQVVGAAYFSITSAHDATLTRVQSNVASDVQVHNMTRDGDIMRMRRVDRLALPAGQAVRLAPSGMHLMLLDLKRPLHVGDQVGLDFTVVDQAGAAHVVHVLVPVRTTAPGQGTPS